MTERRIANRSEVTIPVELGGKVGVTTNVSTTGVYMVLEPPVDLEPLLNFTLIFDASEQRPARVNCLARVVRIDVDRDTVGIAAHIESFGGM